MKLNELFTHTFAAISKRIAPEVKRKVDFIMPSMPMIEACRTSELDFFKPWIEAGRLSTSQMQHAADRYLMGASKSHHPIFWLIDDMHQPLDGLIAPDHWVSAMLKQREPLLQYWRVRHCLFGLHLTISAETQPIGIVESPAAAVVLSELYPDMVWLSTMPCSYFTIDELLPLQGRKITVFPHTDSTKTNYVNWLELGHTVKHAYGIDIGISYALEEAATPDQKERCINLAEYILENTIQEPSKTQL